MQHETVEPGAVLAGRYRIEDLLSEAAGTRCWVAVDEILARSVAVHVLAASDRRAWQLLEAARRSSLVPDGRFVRILDAAEESGCAFVVREWVAGDSLDAVLAAGPLPDRRATWIARECAAAISAAHEVGIAHLRLVPSNVVLTNAGGVKLLGLATDAALYDLFSLDPQADDVRDIGRLLYCCLVGRWPDSASEGLPMAPTENGRVLRPRQVRAGVPRGLDDLCDRLLNGPRRSGEAVHSAAELSAALSAVLASTAESPTSTLVSDAPAPGVASPSASPDATAALALPGLGDAEEGGASSAAAPVQATASPTRRAAEPAVDRRTHGRRRSSRILVWIAVTALVIGACWLAYEIGRRAAESAAGPAPTQSPSTGGTTNSPAAQPLTIANVTDFDPEADGGSGEENSAAAALAVDDDPTTAWETVPYHNNPELGGLKPGVGLLVDLGKSVSVAKVALTLIGEGTSVELRAAPAGVVDVPESASGFQTVANAPQAGERVTLRPAQPVTTRYLLVYLTSLPEDSAARYIGRIAEINVFG